MRSTRSTRPGPREFVGGLLVITLLAGVAATRQGGPQPAAAQVPAAVSTGPGDVGLDPDIDLDEAHDRKMPFVPGQ